MNAIRDFRVTNHGSAVVLVLLDADGEEVQRLTFSWISGLRLLNETAMAVSFGLKTVAAPRGPRA